MNYEDFITGKTQAGALEGFPPTYRPDFLFDFQEHVVDWSVRKGRCAVFADCGMGKTPMQLVWSENVVRHTNRPVLILTPLAVAQQTLEESAKFDIPASRSRDGRARPGINITNYEKLHLFDPSDFAGVVCDESSILKSFDGVRRSQITEFMRKMPYRLLATATAAPNDYIELGTSAEALGELGYTDMLTRFFKNDQGTVRPMRYTGHGHPRKGKPSGGVHTDKWRFKGHAEQPFWRWVCSWSRALRKPSDLGFDDGPFILPELIVRDHLVKASRLADGMLFEVPARGLQEQREERRRTIVERCELVADLADTGEPVLVWCHLNDEGDLLEKLIPGAIQVSGKDDDDAKERAFMDFAGGDIRALVTKPKIGAWGLNFQHCNHVTFFPSHSFEQYYQGVRRCWRFGQRRPVTVDVVTTEGGGEVMANLKHKADMADKMFADLVANMNDAVSIERGVVAETPVEVPGWL